MMEIKGFQQPEPEGKNMLRSEDGPWKLYQRGSSYRIGREVWWGIKWFKDRSANLFAYRTTDLLDAQNKLKKMNEEAYDKKWYKNDKWEVKK